MNTSKNMGNADRIIRVLLALLIITLYFSNILSDTLGIILIVLSLVFIATSVISFCPLYTPFHFSTKRKKS